MSTYKPAQEVLPRRRGGVDWSAPRVVLARDGERVLWWRRSCKVWDNRMAPSVSEPGELSLWTPANDYGTGLGRSKTLHNAGGRLSLALLREHAVAIDAFFGLPVTKHLHPRRTLDVAALRQAHGEPKRAPV